MHAGSVRLGTKEVLHCKRNSPVCALPAVQPWIQSAELHSAAWRRNKYHGSRGFYRQQPDTSAWFPGNYTVLRAEKGLGLG